MLDSVGSTVLQAEECLRLLATAPIGRVVFTDQALPGVLPALFLLHDRMIVLPAGDGSKFSAAVHDTVVAFEADEFDAETRAGWSVTVIGQARLVRDSAELSALVPLELIPGMSGRRQHFIMISTEIVNGFRFVAADDVMG
jgi:nitroimidazol reductase NimA-like FMN-containing flavoprotein (pyridoxamine 5'-phosphate oxidase superfamily)